NYKFVHCLYPSEHSVGNCPRCPRILPALLLALMSFPTEAGAHAQDLIVPPPPYFRPWSRIFFAKVMAFRTCPCARVNACKAIERFTSAFDITMASGTLYPALLNALKASRSGKPKACSTMPIERSASFEFLRCKFTIRLP